MGRMRAFAVAAACCALLAGGCGREHPGEADGEEAPAAAARNDAAVAATRPTEWAQPLEKQGLPNLHKVTDDYYRGAQPTAEGMRALKRMGIKTVVNLRAVHSDRDELGDTDLAYEHIAMQAWDPEEDEVIAFLKIVTAKRRMPVFVHCQHGADRTGMMTAVYRVVVCRWKKDEAIREMKEGGFGFHRVWSRLPRYVAEMDVEVVGRKAGMEGIPVPEEDGPKALEERR